MIASVYMYLYMYRLVRTKAGGYCTVCIWLHSVDPKTPAFSIPRAA